jgi:hypothetical protein
MLTFHGQSISILFVKGFFSSQYKYIFILSIFPSLPFQADSQTLSISLILMILLKRQKLLEDF